MEEKRRKKAFKQEDLKLLKLRVFGGPLGPFQALLGGPELKNIDNGECLAENVAAVMLDVMGVTREVMFLSDRNGEALFQLSKIGTNEEEEFIETKKYTAYKLPRKFGNEARKLLRAYSLAFNKTKCAFDYPEWIGFF